MPRKKKDQISPLPKRKFTCLACKGKGEVFDGNWHWTCVGCKGKGFIYG